MMSSVRDRPVTPLLHSAVNEPAIDGPAVNEPVADAQVVDAPRAYAAPVSGDAVFVPEGEIIARPANASGRSGTPGRPLAPPVSPGRANATLVALGSPHFSWSVTRWRHSG